ncbi:MAG: TetR/AcrR family transcriptional regulator [Gemmatimonadota bacterium]
MPHDTRQRLIDVARELFWRKGYRGTSVAEILEAADANSGSLYHFFPTKQDLLLAVLEWYAENLEAEIVAPARQRTDDPVERVFAILDGYRRALLVTDLTFGCPIGNLALEFKEPDPEVRQLLALNFRHWCEAVEACLDEAADRLPEEVDRKALSRFVLTTMEGGVMQARTHRSIEPFDDSVDQLRTYFDRLLSSAAGARPGGS